MQTAHESLFANPRSIENGLVEFQVTATDADAAIEAYESHRQALVQLGALTHMKVSLPRLQNDGSQSRLRARSRFVERMWARFPGHQYYWLAPDGTFEVWAPSSREVEWRRFLDRERRAPKEGGDRALDP